MSDFGLNVIKEMIEKADGIIYPQNNMYNVFIEDNCYRFIFEDLRHGKNFKVISLGGIGGVLNSRKPPLFKSVNYPDSERIYNMLINRKDELELTKRQKSIENDRAELIMLLGHNAPKYVKRHKDLKFVADEIVRAMNACDDRLTEKQRKYLAHCALLVIDGQLTKLGYLEER